MIVLSVTDSPPKLRGDLTKWLIEINAGVYVGKVSARVREELWKRVCENLKTGRATLVFTVNSEQGMDFYVHNTTWEPVNFDGLKLIRRPLPEKTEKSWSNEQHCRAAAMNRLNGIRAGKAKAVHKQGYVVVDLETTGLDQDSDEILEIAALHIVGHRIEQTLSMLILTEKDIPKKILELTGITEKMQESEGIPLQNALEQFQNFVGDCPIVCHNAPFDRGFLQAAFRKVNGEMLPNKFYDTLYLAKQQLDEVPNYRLATLADFFEIEQPKMHRALEDGKVTFQLYEKLIENR